MELVGIGLAIAYIGGMWKFWSGYNRTNFNRDFVTRLSLGFLWLPLVIVNKNYRSNFTKALKG
jgi:hypothetical protein